MVVAYLAAPSLSWAQADVAVVVSAAKRADRRVVGTAALKALKADGQTVATPSEVSAAMQFAKLTALKDEADYKRLRQSLAVPRLIALSVQANKDTYAIRLREFSDGRTRVEFDETDKEKLAAATKALLARLADRRPAPPPPTVAVAAPAGPATSNDNLLASRINALEAERIRIQSKRGPMVGQIVGYSLAAVGVIVASSGVGGYVADDCYSISGCEGFAAMMVGGGVVFVGGLITGIVSSVNSASNKRRARTLAEEIERLKAGQPAAGSSNRIELGVGPRFAHLKFQF